VPHLLSTSPGRRYTVGEQLAAQMAKQGRLVKNVVVECGFVPFIDGKGQAVISLYVKHTFLVTLALTNLILAIQTPVVLCILQEETSALIGSDCWCPAIATSSRDMCVIIYDQRDHTVS